MSYEDYRGGGGSYGGQAGGSWNNGGGSRGYDSQAAPSAAAASYGGPAGAYAPAPAAAAPSWGAAPAAAAPAAPGGYGGGGGGSWGGGDWKAGGDQWAKPAGGDWGDWKAGGGGSWGGGGGGGDWAKNDWNKPSGSWGGGGAGGQDWSKDGGSRGGGGGGDWSGYGSASRSSGGSKGGYGSLPAPQGDAPAYGGEAKPHVVPHKRTEHEHVPQAESGPTSRTVYVTGIDCSCDPVGLKSFFEGYGTVMQCKLVGDVTRPTRFGFVEFATPEEAASIVAQSQKIYLGARPLRIVHSKTPIVSSTTGPTRSLNPERSEKAMRTVHITGIQNHLNEDQVIHFFQDACGMHSQ
ncbi:Polyadenylate-binding protein-interacting protein 8 [Diplonema papillatum]|nr:Polyadenylate-binding protein-interacting protein 8 [Diplonema papillatum]